MDHRMVECITESVLAQIKAEGPLVSYHQLMEVMMYQPHCLCYLMRSKLPSKSPSSNRKDLRQHIKDAAVDQSGQLLSLSLFLLIIMVTFSVGMLRHDQDALARILGWSHNIGTAATDLFKVLIAIFILTLCNSTPFLYRHT